MAWQRKEGMGDGERAGVRARCIGSRGLEAYNGAQ